MTRSEIVHAFQAVGKMHVPVSSRAPSGAGDPFAEKRDTNPFATDAAPDGAEKLLAANVIPRLRRGLHDDATAVA